MQLADNYIDRVRNLPPAPRILAQLLELLRREDVPLNSVVELVTFDPALTAKVLRRCNSAAAGSAEPVHDLSEGIARLGFNEVYRLVSSVVSESLLSPPQAGYGIGAGELWQHSVSAALAARVAAQSIGLEENLAFTAALLHDLGKLVLSESLEGAYDNLMRETTLAGHSFLEAERAILGVDHAEVGGRILARWNFPEILVTAVRCHHDPSAARPHEQLTACVHLGDIIAHCVGQGHGFQAFAVLGRPEALELLELSSREIESLVLQTALAVKNTAWLFQEVK